MGKSLESFQKSLKAIESFRKKQDRFYRNDKIGRKDIDLAYEAIFLSCYVGFERYIEDQILRYLLGERPSNSSNFARRIDFRSPQVARDCLFNGKSYVDFLPYKKTEDLADIFFTGGRPFTNLNSTQKQVIEKCSSIRNAIAHKSKHSQIKFENSVLRVLSLPSSIRTPAQYLRSNFSATRTRFEQHLSELLNIAIELS